ncbi:hypothetical protein [Sinorhizobium arboris]|uniref:hypothetical protein n=1 Tax=Sinorhizobium arboris TaxID=76745 RepID=UPI0005195C1C|nr:hypothetical protein [Sinorhizobium arboris]
MEGIALQFTIDRRAMTAELPGHLTDRNFAFHELMQTSAIGKGELRIAERHPKISKEQAFVFIGMSHLEIECTRLHDLSQLFKDETK